MTDDDTIQWPLDPQEGPSAYIEVERVDTAENYLIRLKSGTDPDDPVSTVVLNEREFKRAMAAYDTHTMDDES